MIRAARAVVCACLAAGCAGAPPAPAPAVSKQLEFLILEDYDKGADLAEIERDFRLFRSLGVTTWRGSIGWDDYEPERRRYDFAWLLRFADLARRHGIRLRPYLGYTPEWAAAGRPGDGQVWNDPPARPSDFARFAARVAAALRSHADVPSYEIYNEENTRLWWDGTVEEYAAVFAEAADSIRAAVPGAAVLPGGLVWPDAGWLSTVCETAGGNAPIAAAAVHVYAETWTPDSITLERAVADLGGPEFREAVEGPCSGAPVWANEIGFATAGEKSEREQAEWWVRAIAALAADRWVQQIGIYEIKDLEPGSDVIGEAENYHLGLTRTDRTPKLAFHTVRLLVGLLGGRIALEDGGLRVHVREPGAAAPEVHLFRRPDGSRVVIGWVHRGGERATLDLELPFPGSSAADYALDGTAGPMPIRDRRIEGLVLEAGRPRIVVVE